jgi:hypothetical protein
MTTDFGMRQAKITFTKGIEIVTLWFSLGKYVLPFLYLGTR